MNAKEIRKAAYNSLKYEYGYERNNYIKKNYPAEYCHTINTFAEQIEDYRELKDD